MSRSRLSRVTRVTATVCALSLTAAACGGDDDAADATTTTVAMETTTTEVPETTTTEAAPETTEVPETTTTEAAPETTEPEPEPEPGIGIGSIIDVATEADDFTILVAAVEAAGLTEQLATRDLTVLAPTDAAFEALGQETIDALLADPDTLAGILLDHVLPLPQTAAEIGVFNNVLAVGGASWIIDAGDPFMIGDATVIAADIEADNGFIHAIDTVLLVPGPADEG